MKRFLILGLLIPVLLVNIRSFTAACIPTNILWQPIKSIEMTTDTLNMTITRIFEASPEQVWKAWINEELVKQWWGPKGFTCPVAKMDFKEGGVSLVCMRAPKEFGGLDMYNTWSYKKIVLHERIEFTLHFTDKDGNKLDPTQMGLPPEIPKEVPHVITFKALGDKKTEMTIIESGYTTEQAVEPSRAGLVECLDKMAHSLKS